MPNRISRKRIYDPDREPGGADDYIKAHEAETKVLPSNNLTPLDFPEDIAPKRRIVGKAKVTRKPQVDSIADDLLIAYMNEARKLRDKSDEGPLSPAESIKLVKTTEGLAKLSKELREQDKQDATEELTEAELAERLEQALRALKEGA